MIDRGTLSTAALNVRLLALDAIEEAASGHPGMVLGMAELGVLLYGEILSHCPEEPGWPDRDRFVLSAGHASMLLYSLLHLSGYPLSLDDLRSFRKVGSRTPGHPELDLEIGVEVSTGPLGQGFANGVGMAIAERFLAATFNTDAHRVVDHHVYVLAGDGDMMEGVSGEAASLAGHLGLGKLTVFYDSNGMTIDGPTSLSFSENVAQRFEAYGWQVGSADAYDPDQIMRCVDAARAETARPSLVILTSVIGRGAPSFENTAAAHGSVFGAEEVARIKRANGVPEDERFGVFPDVKAYFESAGDRARKRYEEWQHTFADWSAGNPDLRERWNEFHSRECPDFTRVLDRIPGAKPGDAPAATRVVGGAVLDALREIRPNLIGGSADLTVPCFGRVPSGAVHDRNTPSGTVIHYGVREHAMGAISNGLALHGGVRAYCATFMAFSDYMRPAIRMAALMKLPVIFVLSHDSVRIGQDGPTHQPVEHLATLRAIPGLEVFRPADAEETVEVWAAAMERTNGPSVITMTRFPVTLLTKHDPDWRTGLRRGAYVVRESEGDPGVVVVATGADVATAVEAARRSSRSDVRVVSMTCRERFLRQDRAFRSELIPPHVALVTVEAGVGQGWHELFMNRGVVKSIERFGASGPSEDVYEHLGMGVTELTSIIDSAALR